MRYRRPFDSRQRAAAIAIHRQLRRNLNELRTEFPPGSDLEQTLLLEYRQAIQDFARELLRVDDTVEPDRLTELEQYATNAGIRYVITRSTRTGFGADRPNDDSGGIT
jgi:hypothetical protein